MGVSRNRGSARITIDKKARTAPIRSMRAVADQSNRADSEPVEEVDKRDLGIGEGEEDIRSKDIHFQTLDHHQYHLDFRACQCPRQAYHSTPTIP